MSMTVFMIWQMVGIFCAYFGVTLILPLVVFRSLLKGKSITNQILFSFLIGNFYIITMVQILQLLKISHTITLILATVVPAYVVWVKLNKVKTGELVNTIGTGIKRLTEKHLGVKTATMRMQRGLNKCIRRVFRRIKSVVLKNWIDIVLQLILFGILAWVYGRTIILNYGYTASDLPVHNYWINALGDNNIFVAGVYPHGFHCILYFLHEVFGFETYVLLSLFAFVQLVCIHFVLLYFLRLCCKSKYLPYVGLFFYVVGDFVIYATYKRFVSTLPQEFGMIFILPGIYYGFEFFKERYEEVKEGLKKSKSWYSLFGFALSFGLTLTTHFYNTIIAGIFCVAMAIGYLFLFVRKQYFGTIVVTCLISVLVAILPMGIAFATGTKLEGSLYWARNIIVGSTVSEEEIDAVPQIDNSASVSQEESKDNQITNEVEQQQSIQENTTSVKAEDNGNVTPVVSEKSLGTKIKEGVHHFFDKTSYKMNNYIWNVRADWLLKWFWISVVVLLAEGVLYMVGRRFCYGAMLISCAVYLTLMIILLTADSFGLPVLLDSARCCIYLAYMLPILLVMPMDGILHFITELIKDQRIGDYLSLILVAGTVIILLATGRLRSVCPADIFETNEAVTTLTNILHEDKDFTWTICSANDELRMCEDRGYHYEIITLLRNMENWNKDSYVTIPTPRVYFFIEKIPLDYAVRYSGSGQSISEEGAAQSFPHASGLGAYQGEKRWVTMSKMYYWAQEFMSMYPNDMKVYMETDRFVCYVLEQNTYSLYNLAIDYGYNTRD